MTDAILCGQIDFFTLVVFHVYNFIRFAQMFLLPKFSSTKFIA